MEDGSGEYWGFDEEGADVLLYKEDWRDVEWDWWMKKHCPSASPKVYVKPKELWQMSAEEKEEELRIGHLEYWKKINEEANK